MKILNSIKSIYIYFLKIFFIVENEINPIFKYVFIKLRGSNYKSRLIVKDNIKIILDKINKNKKKRLALFVAFHAENVIPLSNIEYLKFLFNCEFDVIYIHNGNLNQNTCRKLQDMGVYLITRENIGQDFGAWKDSFSLIYEKKINNILEWILICNDSNFCIDGNNSIFNEKFKKSLDVNNAHDFISMNCNLGHNLHHQSFFVCFSKRIFSSLAFKNFWKKYIPLDNRFHIIKKGEMKLSNLILNKYKSKVLLRSFDLYQKILDDTSEYNFEVIDKLLPKNLIYAPSCFEDLPFPSGLLKLFTILDNYNPSHVYALLNFYFNNSPFLKKDLTMAGSYSFIQIHDCLIKNKRLTNDLKEEIISTLYSKGISYSYISSIKESIKKGILSPSHINFLTYIDSFLVDKKLKTKIMEHSIKKFL
tara:strand:+ start:24 stop:1280 length:1257 start_codon:yes stop_codon:yes gene_type:complete